MNDILNTIGQCSLWFFAGYLFFYVKEAAKYTKETTRLRKTFVYNDVVIKIYGHEGDPDVYRTTKNVYELLCNEREADEKRKD